MKNLRIHLPDRSALLWLGAAASMWAGVVVGVQPRLVALSAAAGLTATSVLAIIFAQRALAVVVGMAVVGIVSGIMLADRDARVRQAPLPTGSVSVVVEAMTAGRGPKENGSILVRAVGVVQQGETVPWKGPPGWLRGQVSKWQPGQHWLVRTRMRAAPGGEHGRPVAWTGTAKTPLLVGQGGGWTGQIVVGVRSHLLERLAPEFDRSRALLAGFLLGETSWLQQVDIDRMRRSGLSHYVAVSGSNVALFLGALFLVSGPLGWSSRRRAVLGLAGLLFFVWLIGPDPSVLRAAVMAGLVLIAIPFGLLPDIWRVMGAAVGLLLVVSPELAFRLGFILSVAATGGVVIGAKWFTGVRPRWLGSSLGASCGAQAAVTPVLLLSVGSIPLWSPVANVLAAPFVVVATVAGGAGALTGFPPLLGVASVSAQAVLVIAEVTGSLPQVGPGAFLILAVFVGGAVWRKTRPLGVIAAAVAVLIMTLPNTVATHRPAFVALDVGQGDSLLLLGAGGETILVDGGADGRTVLEGLARHRIKNIDLLIVSHSHQDHYGGLTDVLETHRVGAFWYAPFPGQSEEFLEMVEAATRQTQVVIPGRGEYQVGTIGLEVLGPLRRYASPNDQSLVVLATYGNRRVLLTGDIETVAQAELAPPPVDILKVPHQGAATSDPDWLTATHATVAVVSVGPNRFGHPSQDLLSDLQEAGMEVRRTDREGDIVIPLSVGSP